MIAYIVGIYVTGTPAIGISITSLTPYLLAKFGYVGKLSSQN